MSSSSIVISPFFYALMATICFSYASTIFTEFSRKLSPFWMNSFKAIVALIAFSVTAFFTTEFRILNLKSIIALLSSGCIGLMIGDIFLLKSMKELGASRVLMIFGIQPFLLGLGGYYFFNQSFSLELLGGVLLMVACLYTISFESYKKSGEWHLSGLIFGLSAVSLDAIGVLLTKYSFTENVGISNIQVNVTRCVGAFLGFIIIYAFRQKLNLEFEVQKPWLSLTRTQKIKITFGALAGTYFSLMLYLTAVAHGKLSVISSVTSTGPMFAAAFECFKDRRYPSRYLVLAFIFFMSGFLIFSNQ